MGAALQRLVHKKMREMDLLSFEHKLAGELNRVLSYSTPSIVYKRHAIRDTSQIFEKNKRHRLVSAMILRDS